MKRPNLTFSFLLFIAASIVFSLLVFSFRPAASQTRERVVNTNREANNANDAAKPADAQAEVVKVDVDLVTVDALVLLKDNARIVGGLKKEDFSLFEDGTKQEITHFSQDSLPLSVILLIDRGGCLDPYNDSVHRAAREAIDRLKPVDEVAVMSYHDTTDMMQGFTRNRILIEKAGPGLHLIQELRANPALGVPLPIGIKPESDKLTRMAAQCARFEAGQVHMPKQASWLSDFLHEIFAFPTARHDDQIDSVSQFLKWAETRGRTEFVVGMGPKIFVDGQLWSSSGQD